MGVMHRNTYLPSNRMLDFLRIRGELSDAPLFFAGQLTGVEGYVESAAMGHIAGANARLARGEAPLTMPRGTMMGALANYITTKEGTLQPINSNWGLVPAAPKRENGRRLAKPSGGSARPGWRSTCWRSSAGRKSEPLVSQQKLTGLTLFTLHGSPRRSLAHRSIE